MKQQSGCGRVMCNALQDVLSEVSMPMQHTLKRRRPR